MRFATISSRCRHKLPCINAISAPNAEHSTLLSRSHIPPPPSRFKPVPLLDSSLSYAPTSLNHCRIWQNDSEMPPFTRGKEVHVQQISNAACGSLFSKMLTSSLTSNGRLPNFMIKSSFNLSWRSFSSGSTIDDDVEARLMGDDNDTHRGPMFSDGAGDDYAVANGEYGGYPREERWGAEEHGVIAEDIEGDNTPEGDAKLDEHDSDSDMGVPSDEELEGEDTDEELEDLLANTPLFEPPEFQEEGGPDPVYSFRPEGPVYYPGMEYDPEELDISKPLQPRKRERREKLSFSVQEVIDKADFRNVRFLTKFTGETGNILARKEFKMRNKSHGRVTKAIKTARFFGLIPYTNMGRPRYEFNNPYDSDADFYESDDT